MIESLFRKAPLLLLPLFILGFSSPIYSYDFLEKEANGDFYIYYDASVPSYLEKKSDFKSGLLESYQKPDITDFKESKIGVYGIIHINNEVINGLYDMGFANYNNTNGGQSRLILNNDNPNKYIESIEIKWASYEACNASLWLIGKKEEKFGYTQNVSEYGKEGNYDYIETIDPVSENEGLCIYKPNVPVKHLALTILPDYRVYDKERQEFDLATISYIRIHYVSEWTPPVSDPEPEKSHIDIPWLNTGITISNYYNELSEMLGLDSLSSEVVKYDDLDSNPKGILESLTYSLHPEFQPTPKPTSPDDLEDWKWWLFNEFESKNQPYDGYLTEDDVIMCYYDPDNACLVIPAPCSGLYTLTVSNGEKQIFEATLNIWPNIYNSYEVDTEGIHEYDKDQRFNINTVKFPEIICPETQEMISLPYPYAEDKESAFMAENVSICIPGLYNETIYFRKSTQTQTQSTRDADSDGWVKYDGSNLDFKDLTDSNKIYLQLRIDKNGASTPLTDDNNSLHNFEISLSTDASIPTGVESVVDESENAPVELFTLSGMRVVSSSPSSGLYIRRQGSRAGIILIP